MGGKHNPSYKGTFVFTNDFSALLTDSPQGIVDEGDLFQAKSETGICKVICFSENHSLTIPEMEVAEYLTFVGKLKGMGGNSLRKRVDEVSEKCNVGDVRNKLVSKLSKGYKQRVGLAQAIIHNPEVLILDEPTSGLDPKQILETRDLIKGLAGDHTIILSTHILPEVEQICERVVIISRGKLVATDSMENLTNRMRGSEVIGVTVEGQPESGVVQEKLERVAGVSRVILKLAQDSSCAFEIESLQGRNIRADLARAVVEAGWNLTELRPVSMSLEEVFLQLTASEVSA